jgi:LuxR family transcriptional regulator, maltose regulon positive regulatory protein
MSGSTTKTPVAVPSTPRIVAAKLRVPVLRETLIPRQHLLEWLRQGRGRLLTLLSAPAGYGKTTLLAQWATEDQQSRQFAWVSLDESDADPVRLWGHVIRGLQGIHGAVGETSLDGLRGGPTAIIADVVPSLADELDDAPELVLVLEDWHACSSPANDRALDLFVAQVAPAVHVVVSSRSDPRLPLARMRAHDELVELRADRLRLTDDEAAELFARADIELDPGDASRLNERTEGWVAGLHLASILVLDRGDPSAFVASFSGESRNVLDYLASDVLETLPLDRRRFLLRTSILERLSGPLCDAVLDTRGSAAIIEELERANLFLVPLQGRDAYRYHHLFATMLRSELEIEEPEAIPRLHARASAWLEEHGDVEAAVEHAIIGRDTPRASDLVTAQFRVLTNVGQVETLVRWLEQLSWSAAQADPQLGLIRAAVAAQTGRSAEEVERWLEVASARAREGPLANGLASLESGVAIVRSIYLTRGPEVAAEEGQRAVEIERPRIGWLRQALLGLGQAHYFLGRTEAARVALEEARRLPGAHEHAAATANVLAYLSLCELELEEARLAEGLARRALDLLEEHRITGSHTGSSNPRLALGAALMVQGRFREAITELKRATEATAPAAPSYWHAHALLRLAVAHHGIGDVEGAGVALDEAQADLDFLPIAPLLADLSAHARARVRSRPRRDVSAGEELSERELDVLRLLATELSLREIAGELYISLNTVKTHARAIYRKLDTTSRKHAIERATQLGLLEDSPG